MIWQNRQLDGVGIRLGALLVDYVEATSSRVRAVTPNDEALLVFVPLNAEAVPKWIIGTVGRVAISGAVGIVDAVRRKPTTIAAVWIRH